MRIAEFHYVPRWDGPLSGRSFEKQTEDALNGCIEGINALDGIAPSDAYPLAPGAPAPGTSMEYARGDHRHPEQTAISGNAATATKLQNARLISISGDASGQGSFDGSADVDISVSIPDATQSAPGFMSAQDKAKLDGIEAGANAYVLPQATDTVLGGVYVDTVLSDTSENPVQNRVLQGVIQQISDAATTPATPEHDGIMSAADKAKLDGLSQLPRIEGASVLSDFEGGGEVPEPDITEVDPEADPPETPEELPYHSAEAALSTEEAAVLAVSCKKGIWVNLTTSEGAVQRVQLELGIDGARLAGDGLKGASGELQINDRDMNRCHKSEFANPCVFWPVASSPFQAWARFQYTETDPADPDAEQGPDNPSTITGLSSISVVHCKTEGVSETSYAVSLGGTYYGGEIDLATGVMTVTYASVSPASGTVDISSAPAALPFTYADTYGRLIETDDGETLTLQDGAPTGGFVVYELATPYTVQLTALPAMTTLPAGADKFELTQNTLYSSTDGVELQAGYQRFVAVDSALSASSANPVQNSAVTAVLNARVTTAMIDSLFS